MCRCENLFSGMYEACDFVDLVQPGDYSVTAFPAHPRSESKVAARMGYVQPSNYGRFRYPSSRTIRTEFLRMSLSAKPSVGPSGPLLSLLPILVRIHGHRSDPFRSRAGFQFRVC